MKTFFKSVQSALKQTRQTASKVEVKLNEFDNKYTDPIGSVLASTIWNIMRVAVLPFFSAVILAFVIKLIFSYGLNVQSFFVYLAILAIAAALGVVSLMLNVVRGELRYCKEREKARMLSFFSFVETSRFLTNATFSQHPELRSALDLYLNRSPWKVLGRYTMLFFVVPTVVYAIALLPLIMGLGGLHMSLPAVAGIVGVGALIAGLQNARINTHSDPAYFLMSAYRHEDVRTKILNDRK